MSEYITTVIDFPVNITVNKAGIQGPPGIPGTGGGGGVTGNFLTSGQADLRYYQLTNPQQYSTSGNLYNTGSILYNYIIQSSGNNSTWVTLSGNLTQTGILLTNSINSLSGYSSNNIFATGNILYHFISGVSGNLIQTGILLESQINILSGFFQNQINNISGGSSGITNLPPGIVYTSGNQTISGIKTFIDSLNANNGIVTTSLEADSFVYTPQIIYNDSTSISLAGNTILSHDGTQSIDWSNRVLSDGGSSSVNWGQRKLLDGVSNYSIDWSERKLVDTAQNRVVFWDDKWLLDTNDLVTLDWQNRILTQSWNVGDSSLISSINTGQFTPVLLLVRGNNTESTTVGYDNKVPSHGISFYRFWNNTDSGIEGGLYSYSTPNWGGGLILQVKSGDGIENGNTITSVIFQSDGNVNIGTGLALNKLRVDGSIRAEGGFYSGDSNISNLFYSSNNTSGYLTSLSGLSIFYVTGISGSLQNQISILATLNNLYQTGSNLYNDIIGLSGQSSLTYATILNLQSTGIANTSYTNQISGILANQISANAAGVSTLNGLSGSITLFTTGDNHLYISSSNQRIFISGSGLANSGDLSIINSNLTQTGVLIESQINSLSGYSASASNLTITGQILYTDLINLSGQFNANFSTINNLQLTGQSLYSNYTGLSGALYLTGNNLQTQINNLSVNLTNTGVFLENQINTLTNNLYSSGSQLFIYSTNNSNNISGNLYSTGQNLYNYITGLSGQSNINYATNTNLTLTGITLENQIALINTNPSGFIKNAVTGLSITGGNSINGLIGISNGSNITLVQIGNTGFSISAAGGGGGASIPNAITGNGVNNFIPIFVNNSGLGDSIIFNTGQNIGINNIAPNYNLDISGTVNITNSNSFSLLTATGNFPIYQQINLQNQSNSQMASSDLVCTNDIGNENSYYVDLGINSSAYTGAYVGNSGDSYLYSQGNDFYIGSSVTGTRVYLFAGTAPFSGTQTAMSVYNNNVGINNMNPVYGLDISGGMQISATSASLTGLNGLILSNQLPAISTAGIQSSPSLVLSGSYILGGNSVPMTCRMYLTGISGTNNPSFRIDLTTGNVPFSANGFNFNYNAGNNQPSLALQNLTASNTIAFGSQLNLNNLLFTAKSSATPLLELGSRFTTINTNAGNSTFLLIDPTYNATTLGATNFTGYGSLIQPMYSFGGAAASITGIIYQSRVNPINTTPMSPNLIHYLMDASNSGVSQFCVLSTGASGQIPTGYIGINNNFPKYPLDVSGQTNLRNGLNISGSVTYNGTGNATVTPSNTTIPVSWMPIIVTGTQYYIPLYK